MIYWVLTTPRSGSSYIAGEIWRRLGGNPRTTEFFNPNFLNRRHDFRPDDAAPIRSYLQYLTKKFGVGGALGIKALYSQFAVLTKYEDFDESMRDARIIYLYRENMIKQGISFYIAVKTQQWSDRTATQQARSVEASQVPYDFNKISQFVSRLENQNVLLKRLFLVNNLNYKMISYEQFKHDEKKFTLELIDYLGLSPIDEADILPNIVKTQYSPTNEEFYTRFLSDERDRYRDGDGRFKGPPLFRALEAAAV